MMLARVADSLYWLGRYIERAEHHCRLADVMLAAVLDGNDAAVGLARRAAAAPEAGENADPFVSAHALILDGADPGSVISSLSRARENARQVRDQITTETWERLNSLYLRLHSASADRAFNRSPASFLHGVVADLHLFKGAVDATMSHGEGWRFLLLGIYLERGQLIARLLKACFDEERGAALDDHMTQMAVLRMGCALEPYLRVYTAEIQPRLVLQFLLFDQEFPRSVRFSIRAMEEQLRNLGRPGAPSAQRSLPERLAARLSGRLEFADLDEAFALAPLLNAVVQECAAIHDAVYETFVRYPLEQRLPA
ncbi:MAG TPA: alpha-E domain-containing protein [Caulobacteraceae bacterium]|nr:alpha-E domain-containing protein [Caulobacteraceae bacterium]